MPTLQDNKLDPEQQEYEKNFDFERHERELAKTNSNDKSNPDSGPSWSRDNRSVAERESAPSWDTNLNRNRGGKSSGRFSLQGMLKKRANQWIIGSIVGLLLSILVGGPALESGGFVNLKELASNWGNKNNNSFFAKRFKKYLQKKLFNADKKCTGGVKCRFKGGISDKEIDEMKKAGLNPEVGQDGDKKFIKSFTTTDDTGKTVKITADNFDDHYGNNVKFRAQMDSIAKPSSMLLRGKTTLTKIFDRFGIKRNRSLSGASDEERTKNFRADEYGNGNETEPATKPPGSDDPKNSEAAKAANEVDSSITDAAQQERAALEQTGYDKPPSIVPDTTGLDLNPDKATEVASGLVKGGLKGALLGVFSAIDKACSGYQLIRAVVFGAKAYKVIGLIKYAGIFMTLADKLKAGEAKPDEIAYAAGILLKPSTKKESFGKTFFQSEGFNLIFQGKIADHRGLARFTTGTSFLQFFQGAKKTFENYGASKSSCAQVKSWYGQAALFVGGLTATIFSAGTLEVAGIAAGAGLGMIVAVLTAYVTPLLIQYAAGTVAPDPTDAEGGYGAGSALGAGIGAFGHFTGSANGERILTNKDATAVEMASNKEMAFQTKVDNYGKSPFSPTSDTSIPNQLALAVAPVISAPISQGAAQTLASIVTSPLSLFGSSFSNIVTGGVDAQNDINKGGQFCADEDYQAMNLAVDAFCNPIPGETDATINDPKYDPQAVLNYMLPKSSDNPNGHDHINDDGTPKSDDYKKYIASCVGDDQNAPPPISPDGGGSDVSENVDTRWCVDPSEEFTMFRMYAADSALDSAHDDSVNGTLGQEDGGTDNGSTVNTYPNGQIPASALCDLGPAWPNQKVQCAAGEKFTSLNDAYKQQFGVGLSVTDSYRTLDQQNQCKASANGDKCGTPGTSWHGCGLAVDLGGGVEKFDTPQYNWMLNNAPPFGWIAPPWAEKGGSNPEPWHWEFGTNGLANGGTCRTS